MKNYREIADSVFERRDRYVAAQKKKKQCLMWASASVGSCALVALMGFEMVNSSWFRHEPAVTDRVVYPPSTTSTTERGETTETIPTEDTTASTLPEDTSPSGTQGSILIPTQPIVTIPSTQTTETVTVGQNDTQASTTHSTTQGITPTETTEPTATKATTSQTKPTVSKTTTSQTKPTATKTTTSQTKPTATKTTTSETKPTVSKTTTNQTKPTMTKATTSQTKSTATKTTTSKTKPTVTRPTTRRTTTQTTSQTVTNPPSKTEPTKTTAPPVSEKVLIVGNKPDNTGINDSEVMSKYKKYVSRLLEEMMTLYEGEDVVYGVIVNIPMMEEYSDDFWNSNEEWARLIQERDEAYNAYYEETKSLNPSWDGSRTSDIEIWTDTMQAKYDRYISLIRETESVYGEHSFSFYEEIVEKQQIEALKAVSNTEPVDILANSHLFFRSYYVELTADAINALVERGGYRLCLATYDDMRNNMFDA